MEASAGHEVVQALLDEQAALRRVATLVAEAGDPARVFPIVTEEVGRLLAAQTANMVRYRHDGTADVLGQWNEPGVPSVPIGARIELDGGTLAPKICRSGRPERVDDYAGLTGLLAERLQALGIHSGVGAPIIFDGELWGAVVVSSVRANAFPAGAEHRIAAFTELIAQALANAEAREQLAASRARVVAAGDAERRRLERNLHDGAQQRLVALAIGIRIADRLIDEDPEQAHAALARASDELSASLAELREIARGLHPAVLSDHGLEPAVKAVAQRAGLPVELTFDLAERPSPSVEVAAYYVIAESLTNVAKYAKASHASVEVRALGDRLLVAVTDDGVGGADTAGGSGLLGLGDRVAALGGRLHVESPPGQGTSVRADVPSGMTAVLLVPGSWHGAWCWDDVLDRLTAAGVVARAIDLPSNDGASGLADDAAAVRGALAELGEPAVVVGHSYGGVAISEGAAGAAGLVYLCAFMLDRGEALLDAMQHQLPDWIDLDEQAGSQLATRTEEVLYGDCTPAIAAAAGARLTRQSVAAIATPQSAAAWQETPSTYVICEQDRAVPPPAQEAMSARAGTVHRLSASHSPFLSRPDEVAEIVLGAL